MSNDINEVKLIGRLGQDPECRYTPNGTLVVTLSVATGYSAKNAAGEWEDRTEWHKVGVSRRQAEYASQAFKRGTLLYVSGFLRTNSWEKDGVKHYRTEIAATQVIGLRDTIEVAQRNAGGQNQQSKPDQGYQNQPNPTYERAQQTPGQRTGPQQQQKQPNFTPDDLDDGIDDIPF